MATPNSYDTSRYTTDNMGQAVDSMMKAAENSRRSFERHWYDNNFFDEGYHFRYVSRTQNKIIDLTKESNLYAGMRAIPKASRQIRGMVNLLVSNDYVPVVYPDKVDKTPYPDSIEQGPNGPVKKPNPQYQELVDKSKTIAKKKGYWLEDQLSETNQDLTTKLAFMGILTAKHNVSYLEIYPDSEKEKICTRVRDAFDVYLIGELNEIEDQPFVIIGTPRNIAEIKADERFDKDQRISINPDNRHASSEIKEAYMNARFGRQWNDDRAATIIQKCAYIKEYLNEENYKRIKKQPNGGDILRNRDFGDPVYRQTFTAGNIWLRDEYIDIDSYPIVDLRFEYGPIYQTPLIERFIPANKSLDVISSRIERYANAMPLGVVLKRKGEDYHYTNLAGGQEIEYKATPPQIQPLANLPSFLFNYLGLLNEFIEEQGVSTATLGNLPAGVKGYQAIESLKESEYANLVIPDRMLRRTIRMVAEKFLELGNKYIVQPQNVQRMNRGEPDDFTVVGKSAMDKRAALGVPVENSVIPLRGDEKVIIEVEKGMAYTQQGQQASAKQLSDYVVQMTQMGVLPPQAAKVFTEQFLETFKFGATGEFMDAVGNYQDEGMLTDQQSQKIMTMMAQVLKDSGIGQQDPKQDIMKAKIGAAEALKETGVIDDTMKAVQNGTPQKPPSETISYKDAPSSIKRQMEQQAGMQPAIGEDTPVEVDQKIKAAEVLSKHVTAQKKTKETAK